MWKKTFDCWFPRRPCTGPNCFRLRLPSVTICRSLRLRSVYDDIKPHMLRGNLELTLSDETAIQKPSTALSLKTWVGLICCVCSVFKREWRRFYYLFMRRPSQHLIPRRMHLDQYDIRTTVNLGLCCALLLGATQTHTDTHNHKGAGREALVGSWCVSLTIEDHDWGIGLLCNISLSGMLLLPVLQLEQQPRTRLPPCCLPRAIKDEDGI